VAGEELQGLQVLLLIDDYRSLAPIGSGSFSFPHRTVRPCPCGPRTITRKLFNAYSLPLSDVRAPSFRPTPCPVLGCVGRRTGAFHEH
jgi:hypothetical protein